MTYGALTGSFNDAVRWADGIFTESCGNGRFQIWNDARTELIADVTGGTRGLRKWMLAELAAKGIKAPYYIQHGKTPFADC